MSKEELLKYLIAEIDLIMHDKDYLIQCGIIKQGE